MSEVTFFGTDLVTEVRKFVAPVLKHSVTDATSMEQAREIGKTVKTLMKKVDDRRTALVGPLNDQVKVINAAAKEVCRPLLDAEARLKSQLLTYSTEIERVRVEALRKQQEEERKKLAEEQAERDREKAELAALQEEELKNAEAAAKALGFDPDETKASILAEQEKQAEDLHIQHAKQAVQSHVEAAAERKAIEDLKVKGARKDWDFEVTDVTRVPREFLIIDEKKIREHIRQGARDGHIPGVRIFQRESVSLGRG